MAAMGLVWRNKVGFSFMSSVLICLNVNVLLGLYRNCSLDMAFSRSAACLLSNESFKSNNDLTTQSQKTNGLQRG